jgi:hypothetical protein
MESKMKEFAVGLLFIIICAILVGLGYLFLPLLLVLGIILRIAVISFLIIFAVWFLGKVIILILEALNNVSKRH